MTDYTKMKPGGKLIKCPKCGKTGRLRKYVDGSASVTHTEQVELGMFNAVKEYCYFNWE